MSVAQSAAGLRDSQDFSTGERPKNFRELILWRDPNGSAPLTALMSKMRKESVDDSEFNWWEEEQKAVRLKNSATITTTNITTMVVVTTEDSTALDLVTGDMLLVEKAVTAAAYSFELLRVATTPTTVGTFHVTRASAGTTGQAIPANAYLLKVGSSYAEGSGAPTATSRNPTKYLNYAQIFKTTYNVTNTARKTRYRTGDPVKNDKKRKAFDHAAAMEHAWFFGAPSEDTTSASEPLYYTGGLLHFLGANYDATTKPTIGLLVATTFTEEDFLDATYGMWDFNVPESGDERIAFAGNGALNALNKLAASSRTDSAATRVNYEGTIDMFGMRLQKWILPQGTIYLKSHPLFNTNSYFTNSMAIINPPGIRYRPMDGRDTKFIDNIQLPDEDQIKGQWLTQAGVEFNHLRSMRWIQFT